MITALARAGNGSTDQIAARLSVVTAPALEPLTVAEAKRQILLGSSAGEPAPTAPTVALPSTPVAGNCDNGAWRIGYTFGTADGETELGPLSAVVTIADKTVNGKIAVSNVAIGGSAVLWRKAYAVPPTGGNPKFAALLNDNTSTIQTIDIAAAGLGAEAPTTNTTNDPDIVALITAARLLCESDPSADGTSGGTGRALLQQTFDLKLDGFPWGWLGFGNTWNAGVDSLHERRYLGGSGLRPIMMPKPPLISVTSITYVDPDGVTQTWSPSLYTVDAPAGDFAEPGRIYPVYGQVYPVTRAQPEAVTIRFVCGYGATAAAVPQMLKSAMKLLIGVWYANREAGVVERASADVIPFGVDALLQPFRVM